jgi:hypothetical protein
MGFRTGREKRRVLEREGKTEEGDLDVLDASSPASFFLLFFSFLESKIYNKFILAL